MDKTIVKIPDEQLKKLRDIADNYAQLTADIGRAAVKKLLLQNEIDETDNIMDKAKEDYKVAMETEKQVHQDMLEKYGQGQINIETGEFIRDENQI